MLAPGGPIDNTMSVGREGALDLCAKAWKTWSFAQYDLRGDLRARGVDDPDLLPGYHYRDDALKVWDVIADFVGAMVLRHSIVATPMSSADFELQAWVRELADPEIGNFRGLADSSGGVGQSIKGLVHIVTTMSSSPPRSIRAPTMASTTCTPYIPNVPGAIFARAANDQSAAVRTKPVRFPAAPAHGRQTDRNGPSPERADRDADGAIFAEVFRRKSGRRADRQTFRLRSELDWKGDRRAQRGARCPLPLSSPEASLSQHRNLTALPGVE